MDERHFFNPHFKIRSPVKKYTPIPDKVYDKLFYTIYHKLNQSVTGKYNEALEKIKVVEKLETHKLKHHNKILEDLLKETISLYCLDALCTVWNVNICWHCDYFFYECRVDPSAPMTYLSHKYEWVAYTEDKIQLFDLFKPLKSISYYTLAELKELTQRMNGTGKTKAHHYEEIQKYFKHIKLI